MGEKRRARRRRRHNRSRIARATVKPQNEIKLSAALERMIRPYLHDGLDLVQHRVLVDDERLIIDTNLQPMDESNRYKTVASTKLEDLRTTQG